MKFYKWLKNTYNKSPRLFLIPLAIICATTMWYSVRVKDRLEAQIEVNLDYHGMPPGLIVVDGLVNKVTVRLRGPEMLLRAIPQQMLRASIDLSNIKKGITTVPVGNGDLPEFRAFDIIDIQPPKLEIVADQSFDKSVRVKANVESPLGGDALTIENVSVNPGTVILKGPESIVSSIQEIPVTLRADAKSKDSQQIRNIVLATPNFVTATPSSVEVKYTITSSRITISRVYPIVVSGDTSHIYEIIPDSIKVNIEVPEALAKDKAYLNKLTFTVAPPEMTLGQTQRLRTSINLPEGMSFATPPSPREVLVTRMTN